MVIEKKSRAIEMQKKQQKICTVKKYSVPLQRKKGMTRQK